MIVKGYYVGENFSGYAPFHSDLTDFLNYGGKNALTVRVDTTLGEGWFYEGAGIYRHVWLTKTAPMHVAQWGLLFSHKFKKQARRSPFRPKWKTIAGKRKHAR